LLVLACFALGVIAFAYVGAVIGFEVGAAFAGGLDRVSASPPGAGSYLDPIVKVVKFFAGFWLGILSGTFIGVVAMRAACRHLIIPRLRAVRWLSRDATARRWRIGPMTKGGGSRA
jgi:hypothetical protein